MSPEQQIQTLREALRDVLHWATSYEHSDPEVNAMLLRAEVALGDCFECHRPADDHAPGCSVDADSVARTESHDSRPVSLEDAAREIADDLRDAQTPTDRKPPAYPTSPEHGFGPRPGHGPDCGTDPCVDCLKDGGYSEPPTCPHQEDGATVLYCGECDPKRPIGPHEQWAMEYDPQGAPLRLRLSGTHFAIGDALDKPLCGTDDAAMFSCGEALVTCVECRKLMEHACPKCKAPVSDASAPCGCLVLKCGSTATCKEHGGGNATMFIDRCHEERLEACEHDFAGGECFHCGALVEHVRQQDGLVASKRERQDTMHADPIIGGEVYGPDGLEGRVSPLNDTHTLSPPDDTEGRFQTSKAESAPKDAPDAREDANATRLDAPHDTPRNGHDGQAQACTLSAPESTRSEDMSNRDAGIDTSQERDQ